MSGACRRRGLTGLSSINIGSWPNDPVSSAYQLAIIASDLPQVQTMWRQCGFRMETRSRQPMTGRGAVSDICLSLRIRGRGRAGPAHEQGHEGWHE